MRPLLLLIALLLVTRATAQRFKDVQTDTSTVKWRFVTTFHPIFSGSGYQIIGQPHVLIGLEAGAELRVGLDLFQDRYRVGPSGKLFWTTGEGQPGGWYHLLGIYNQYDFLHKQRNRLYVELAGYHSNLRFDKQGMFTAEPLPSSSSWYLGVGAGVDLYLHPRWDISFGYQHHFLLNGPAIQSFWSQMVFLGVHYHWYKRQKPGWGWRKRLRAERT